MKPSEVAEMFADTMMIEWMVTEDGDVALAGFLGEYIVCAVVPESSANLLLEEEAFVLASKVFDHARVVTVWKNKEKVYIERSGG